MAHIGKLEKVFEGLLLRRHQPIMLQDMELSAKVVAKGDGLLPAFLLQAAETWNWAMRANVSIKLEKDQNAVMFIRANTMPEIPPQLLFPVLDYVIETIQTRETIFLDPLVDHWFSRAVDLSPEFQKNPQETPQINIEGLRA